MTEHPAPKLFDLGGRVALVTGASGGLGQAIAHAYAAHGAKLILSDVDAEAIAPLASQCRKHGSRVDVLAADLSIDSQVRALARQALDLHGRIDVLVCNAGVQGPAGSLSAVSSESWQTVFQVNLASAQVLCSAIAPAMAQAGGGSIILMSSIAGLRGNKAIGLYGLTKAALAQMARNLAVEWGPDNVRANAIAPGLIRTPLARALIDDPSFMARRLQATPLRRVGEAFEIAGAAVFLASPAGGFITGQTLVVDGGTLISDGG